MVWGGGISAACSKPTRTATAELRDGAISSCCLRRRLRVPVAGTAAASAGASESSPPESSPQPLEASALDRGRAHAAGKAGGLASGGLVAFTLSDSRARTLRSAARETLRRRKQGSSSTSASVTGRSTPSPLLAAMWEALSSARRYRRRRRAAENGRGVGSVREWQRRGGI